ncbi:MAG: type 1 glutamine amidotransferase [Deltaproteobacteria bacterium]|nr:type 1 glutamine amidotransferase [Deltaproteobacteria bacterium]
MSDKTFLIVQHMDWEGPGQHLLAALHDAKINYRLLEAWREPIPPVADFAGFIVLGGGPNVNEEEQFPYLVPLKAAIREVISSGKAYLGFCLGHQLLAHVLGCRVGPLPRKSVGFITGELTPAGLAHPVFQGISARPKLFKWHGQGVLPPLPAGIEILAHSDAAPVEAVGVAGNPKVVGVQFDNHVGPNDVEKWLKADAAWALSGSEVDPAAVMAAARAQDAEMSQEFHRVMRNFLRLARSS